jgi:hypothetical protein
MPLVVAVALSMLISSLAPSRGTLAYATSMSVSNLHQATNNHRAKNGRAALSLNSKLISAAQAKAKDMAERDYWSHNTPDGKEPWVFIDAAGYRYLKAGENLAYGFATSEDTVVGWMNSPSHKANMLDSAFTEVGFGFVNSPDFNDTGPQTIVVAMYGKPQTLASTAEAPAPAKKQAPPPATEQENPPKDADKTVTDEAAEATALTSDAPSDADPPVSQQIVRAQSLTNGQAPWAFFAAGLMAGVAAALLLAKHGLLLRHLLRDSKKFIVHHPLLDSVLLGLAILGFTLTRTVGTIL